MIIHFGIVVDIIKGTDRYSVNGQGTYTIHEALIQAERISGRFMGGRKYGPK